MRLEHRFQLDVPPEATWRALLDLDGLVGALPGSHLVRRAGEPVFVGDLAVSDGADRGACIATVRSLGHDEDTRTLALRFRGRQAGGHASATGTLAARVHDVAGAASVSLEANLDVAGHHGSAEQRTRVAQAMLDRLGQELEHAVIATLATRTPPTPSRLTPRRRAPRSARFAWAGAVAALGIAALVLRRRLTPGGRR
jgi:carbon monoxide dehydrogenase subunit G